MKLSSAFLLFAPAAAFAPGASFSRGSALKMASTETASSEKKVRTLEPHRKYVLITTTIRFVWSKGKMD
jgi:hypothetical protein